MPLVAQAGGSATAPPAVKLNLTIQATAQGSSFNVTADGVTNQNGDSQITFTTPDHTYSTITVGGVEYQSVDGGPYQVAPPPSGSFGGSSSPITAGIATMPGAGGAPSPACVAAETGLSGLFQQAIAGQGAGAALGIQDLGPTTVGGMPAEHIQGTIDLGQAVRNPQLMQALTPLLTNCGGGDPQVAFLLPLVLSGSTMNVDASVDPSTGVPLQLNLSTNIPFLQLQTTISGQMMPLSTPATITAPS
jgi:hypothetical protein